MPTIPVTRVDLFTVRPSAVPRAVARMAMDRRRLRCADPIFWKLLGTGDGRTFDARDADVRRWVALTVWPTAQDAAAFVTNHDVVGGWRGIADEHWWTLLRTLRVSGSWSRRRPFGSPDGQRNTTGPVAALTRARLRWSRAPRFWRSVPAVTADLDRADGLLLRLGIGEAPLGLQGTFSLWSSPTALQRFAYRGGSHRDVIRRSTDERWYVEELFARFAVVAHGGTIFGSDPLAGRSV